jgi:hypothetical protein
MGREKKETLLPLIPWKGMLFQGISVVNYYAAVTVDRLT